MTRARLRAALHSVIVAGLFVVAGSIGYIGAHVRGRDIPPTRHVTYAASTDPSAEIPFPWQTATRLQVRVPDGIVSGSGTVIDSTAERSVILTCAHLFAHRGQLTVDLFAPDLDWSTGKTGRLHFLETHQGRAVQIDKAADVAIVVFEPGRVLSASPVLPESEPLQVGQKMTAVGCGGGEDATAWTTQILALQVGAMGRPGSTAASWTECTTDPRQGRSGGGLYTLAGYVAGVCDFGTGQNTGLYASPASIRSIVAKAGVFDRRPQSPCPPGVQCPTPQSPPARPREPGLAGIPRKPAPAPAGAQDAPAPPAPAAPVDLASIEAKIPDEATGIAFAAGIAALLWPRRKAA